MLVDEILDDLHETWDYTTEELSSIREQLLRYAYAALHDTEVAEEVLNEYDE